MLSYFSLWPMRRHLTSSCYSMKLSAIMRCVCWAGVPTAGSFITIITKKKTKEPSDRVLLGTLLFGCVVSFGVCNLCLDAYFKSQVHPWHHTQYVLLIFSRCQISKISYSHVQDSQVTTLWSFLVVRNCFENLSWYFLVKQETLAPVTSHPLMFELL